MRSLLNPRRVQSLVKRAHEQMWADTKGPKLTAQEKVAILKAAADYVKRSARQTPDAEQRLKLNGRQRRKKRRPRQNPRRYLITKNPQIPRTRPAGENQRQKKRGRIESDR